MTMNEHDTFHLRTSVTARAIGSGESVILPEGLLVSIVFVYGEADLPLAYEVEGYLPERDEYALATIAAGDI
jgi:hypothetical protein